MIFGTVVGEEDRLHFVAKEINNRSNQERFSNRDFEIYNGHFCL